MNQLPFKRATIGLLCLGSALGCQGMIAEPTAAVVPQEPPASSPPSPSASASPSASPSPTPSAPPPPDASALERPGAFGATGLRRLSKAELQGSLVSLFGVDPGALLATLPDDGSTRIPFDDDYTSQSASPTLILSLSAFADAYAALVTADPARRDLVLAGCLPSGPADAACFEALIRALGRRMLRRPLVAAEVGRYAVLLAFAEEEGRFDSAVELLISALIQHPEQLYRIETGAISTRDSALIELEPFAVAARLAFLLSGAAPDEALLSAAESGALRTPSERRAQAERLLATPAAARHWARFHAQWLGYFGLTLPGPIAADFSAETERLVARLLESTTLPWLSVFTAEDTYLTPALAEHYGLPRPAAPGWVRYPPARGGGLLSHGTMLAQGSKFGDTSPTLRGARLLERVLCGQLGTPPTDVDTDNPPPGPPGACKTELYTMRGDARCAGCHARTDNLGFGLENLGATGQWREREPGRPSCVIEGRGQVAGQDFRGPRELGAILASSSEVRRCASLQLFRFTVGRPELPADQETLGALAAQVELSPRLADLLLALAASPALAHRPR